MNFVLTIIQTAALPSFLQTRFRRKGEKNCSKTSFSGGVSMFGVGLFAAVSRTVIWEDGVWGVGRIQALLCSVLAHTFSTDLSFSSQNLGKKVKYMQCLAE